MKTEERKFLLLQRERIINRILKYVDPETLSRMLDREKEDKNIYTDGSISSYINHKRKNVLPSLIRAIKLIDSGGYGICQKCGKNIDKKRLEIVPAAINCVQCENQRDY